MNAPLTCDDLYYSTLADDPDLAEIVELFVAELPHRLAHVCEALEAGDLAGVARIAHQIKGAGGSHGFAQLTPVAAQLERVAKGGAPLEAVRMAVDDLVVACGKVRSGLPS